MTDEQYRAFHPDTDAKPVMHRQYLRRDEEVLFESGTSFAEPQYRVRGRHGDGSARKSAFLSALRWMALAPIRLGAKMIEMFLSANDFGEERGVVPVTVTGARPDCRAAALADSARGRTGVWVLTDRRFAFVEVHDPRRRESGPESDRERHSMARVNLGLVGEWSVGAQDRPLGPVETEPVFEVDRDGYRDLGRRPDRHGVFHVLEFPDGSGFALGVDRPVGPFDD